MLRQPLSDALRSLFFPFLLATMSTCGQIPVAPDTTDRVAAAEQRIGAALRTKVSNQGGTVGNALFLRAFKQEQVLELWMRRDTTPVFHLFETYPVCYVPGEPGPKRKEGDLQVPEGIYVIDVFNPKSSYHLSLRVNYPNASDLHFSDAEKPGGEIYIHGGCASVGCLPLGDAAIEEVYLLAKAAKEAGQDSIPVHIFPCRMTDPALNLLADRQPMHRFFWQNLQTVYDFFEKNRRLPRITVNNAGHYQVEP
jgi:murein L,D-transpeptidase YafK